MTHAEQPAEPRLIGWGRHPTTNQLLHFTVEGFGENVLVFRKGNEWKASTYRTVEEIAAAHRDQPAPAGEVGK